MENKTTLSSKSRSIKIILKVILRICCVIGLFYQLNILFDEYMTGKTMVNIRLESKTFEKLPSISICLDQIYSAQLLAENDNQTKLIFHEYKQLYNLYKNAGYSANTKKIRKNLSGLFGKMRKLNDQSLKNMTWTQIVDNYSVKYIPDYKSFINVILNGLLEKAQNKTEYKSTDGDLSALFEPIESLVFSPEGSEDKFNLIKCFTFFSHLIKAPRQFWMKYNSIGVQLNLSNELFPFYEKDHVRLSLHSPNILPKLSMMNFIKLNVSRNYDFHYSVVYTKLLDGGYDTDCLNYDLDHKYSNNNMRWDCITKCYHNFMRDYCNVTGVVLSDYPLRTSFLEWDHQSNSDITNTKKKGRCIREVSGKTESFCKTQCKVDCSFNFYMYDISDQIDNQKTISQINFRHNKLPDLYITYSPQITFISFVSNFGGLLGMWLGLSVLTIFDNSVQIMRKLVFRPKYTAVKFKPELIFQIFNLKQVEEVDGSLQSKIAHQYYQSPDQLRSKLAW